MTAATASRTVPHALTLAHLTLIDALALRDVEDYLREQAALRNADTGTRPKHAALHSAGEAA